MIILDLDGCISNDSHRLDILKTEPKTSVVWDAYHGRCLLDKPANIEVWADRCDIIVLTGRPHDYLQHTLSWFRKNGLNHYFMQMRPVGNTESAVVLKRRWAEALLDGGYHIDIAYDDRPDIIEEYKKLGIRAEILKAHDREWV